MRTALLLATLSLLGTACFHESYDRDRYDRAQAFEAYTTGGDSVLVEPDARTGNLYIVQPERLRGERVALVDRDNGGRALVTRDVQMRRRYGNADPNDQYRGEDDRHDDHHR
jgi:hypothetical protein